MTNRAPGSRPTIGVVISTYNQPRWLALSLEGWARQAIPADEIVIADDGSGEETRSVITSLAPRFRALQHVWQEDDGFRKNEILNKAIVASTSDYLIFTDGDCIPRKDFLAVHAEHLRPGRFLSGGCSRLPMETSKAIDEGVIASQVCFDMAWLRQHGMHRSIRNMKLRAKGAWATLLDATTTTNPTFNGHNSSVWREDLLRVNGFDTRMRYGGEDRELGERLMNAGVQPFEIRYRAICVHLEHGRGYVTKEDRRRNDEIRRVTSQTKATRTEFGITG